jgi:hypothetical protein
MLIVAPEWIVYLAFVLGTAWGLSTILLLWLFFREWVAMLRVVATGKVDGDTDKLVAMPVEVK